MPDIVDRFSTHLKNVLTRALCLVVETNQDAIRPEHLLWALGTQKGCIGAEVIKKAGVKMAELKKLVGALQVVRAASAGNDLALHLSDDAKRIVEKAVLTANVYGHRYVGTEHLLSGILQIESSPTEAFWRDQQVDMKELRGQLSIVLKSTSKFPEITDAMVTDSKETTPAVAAKEGAPVQEKKVTALEYFSVELTSREAQKKIDPVIGREEEIQRLMEILCRRTKNNPLLLGEPGVGKTAIVEGLAKRITQGHVPSVLARRRIFALDMALLVAGTMYRGEFDGRLKQIVEEARQDPESILFIDEIHTIIGAGSAAGSLDAANILKPALARGEIRCIGATTPAEYKKQIETDSALERRLQCVMIEEPSPQMAVDILEGVAPYYERFHRVRIAHDALTQAVKLSVRYVQDRQLPDKAIDLIDEAAAAVRIRETNPGPLQQERELGDELVQVRDAKRQAVVDERFEEACALKEAETRLLAQIDALRVEEDRGPVPVITPEEIARVVARIARIPVEEIVARDLSHLQRLEEGLRTQVLGQDTVIDTVAGALKRARAGIAHPARPLASFLFLGPSGVGKTALAKAMAELLYHSKHHFIRLDMSEYAEGFTMSKLIGSPPGYVGYKDTANLTDRVKARPYSVVLFDEIEKAHRDVQNLLLQILEEGELTDATGRLINFKNTIVVLTSNIGLERFERGGMGFMGGEQTRSWQLNDDLRAELNDRLRPELVNRLDHVCVFEPLSISTLELIAAKQLDELTQRLKEQGVAVSIDPSVVGFLSSKADAKMGARTIRTHIQTSIEHPLAQHLSTPSASKRMRLAVKDGKVVVTKSRT